MHKSYCTYNNQPILWEHGNKKIHEHFSGLIFLDLCDTFHTVDHSVLENPALHWIQIDSSWFAPPSLAIYSLCLSQVPILPPQRLSPSPLLTPFPFSLLSPRASTPTYVFLTPKTLSPTQGLSSALVQTHIPTAFSTSPLESFTGISNSINSKLNLLFPLLRHASLFVW